MTLIEYIENEGLKPIKRGNRHWMTCPFHADENPSFTISEKDGGQVWFCYSCKHGGGPAQFLSEYKDIPLYEAKREWAKLNGEAPPDGDRELLTRIVESLPPHQYLVDRGITKETQTRFHVGYCADYKALLKSFNITEERAAELGLFDLTNRMVYPFYDQEGVYKISSRPIDIKDYKSSDEKSKFFKRGLWGWQLLRGEEAWVFEGQHDAMVARQAKYQSLSAGGTEITPDGWEEIRKNGIKRLILVPDGDAGGRGWFERVARKAPKGLSVEFVVIPSGDPDDAILDGTFKTLKRLNPFEWYVTAKWGSPSDLAEKCRMLIDAKEIYQRMPPQDRAAARVWFKQAFGDDESLVHLPLDVQKDIEAERVVLANCLYSNNARIEALQELEEEYFTTDIFRRCFSLIREVQATPQLLFVELGIDLSNYADIVNYRRYIDRVYEIGSETKVSTLLKTADASNVGEIIENLYKITDKVVTPDGASLVRKTMGTINKRTKDPNVLGIEIANFPTLNKALLGWCPGRLILVSGNSGHGKTTMACNFLNNVVDESASLFFSLEMSDSELMEKLIAIRSGVPSMKIATGSMEQFEYEAVSKTADSFLHGNLEIVTGVTDLHKIIAIAKAQIIRRKVRFIFIDYVQLITLKSRAERWEQLMEITKTIKNQICMTSAVTVVAISQLKKSSLNSDIPDAADQAGSYGMLADADAAIAAKKVNPEETKDGSNFMMVVGKNRFGWDDIVIPCSFDRTTQRIVEKV